MYIKNINLQELYIYFVLYGQMDFKNTKVGKFGEAIGLGWTDYRWGNTSDYKILLSFLEKNYEVKNEWRKEKGLLESVKEVD